MEKFKLPKDVKSKWVKALRSRKYKQGCQVLVKTTLDIKTNKKVDVFCCLGVACDIEITSPLCEEGAELVDYSFLPKETQEFLASKNDGTIYPNSKVEKWGFKKIATWIERNL